MSRIDFVTGAPEKYAHLVDALSTASEQLRTVMRDATPVRTRQATTDDWGIPQILGHMRLYAEKNGVFFHQMASMTDPERSPVDDTLADTFAALDPSRLVVEIEAELTKTVELLSHTPDAAWGRPGRIRGARRSLRQQVKSHADHMHEHVAQIATVLGK